MPRPSKHPSNTNTNAASSSSSRSQKPVFFHGPHRGNGYLSQWYWAPFIVDGIRYETAEKWMMLHKARTFHDEAAERAILASTDPKEAKELGRLVEGFDERVWDGVKKDVVKQGNMHKFTASEDAETLRALLLATGDREIAEASASDREWGIGFREEKAEQNRRRWGKNLLGIVLMEVRGELRDKKEGG